MRMVVAVMALLAAGCGADAEPWSTNFQVSFVNGCITETQAGIDEGERMKTAFEEAGVTAHDACRCVLDELEERYSESDFFILSPTEQDEARGEVIDWCMKKLLDL